MQKNKKKGVYEYNTTTHNMDDPNEIVSLLYKYFLPETVVDLGCGIGNFLFKFKELGAKNVLGIDGEWSDNELQMLKGNELILKNIGDELEVKGHFDLALSLEVAEHLDNKYAPKIVNDLTNFSDLVVFSAAIPNQGGQDHINEQWPDYWVNLFNAVGYDCYDVFRASLWNNPHISYWYKQNMFVAVNSSNNNQVEKLLNNFPFARDKKNEVLSLVHPQQFNVKINRINYLSKLMKGKATLREYKDVFNIFLRRLG